MVVAEHDGEGSF